MSYSNPMFTQSQAIKYKNMCIPRKPETIDAIHPPQPPVVHVGGHPLGVWPVNPLPPDTPRGGKEKKTTEPCWNSPPNPPSNGKNSPPSRPPQIDSDSDGAKERRSKRSSGSDQKHARPDTTTTTSPPPRSSSESDGPSPRKVAAFKQLPPPLPEKHKMGATQSLPENHHRNWNSQEAARNTGKTDEFRQPPLPPPATDKQKMRPRESLANNKQKYENSGALEEQSTKSMKTSSHDNKNTNIAGTKFSSEEEIFSNHTVFPKTRQDYW